MSFAAVIAMARAVSAISSEPVTTVVVCASIDETDWDMRSSEVFC